MLTRRIVLAGMLCGPLPFALSSVSYARRSPEPTGTTGYEEIVQAGERLREAKAEYLTADDFTLTKKRAYLADPACQEARSLLRQGLAKQPVSSVKTASPGANLPVYALFRGLVRLLAVEIYVDFADGNHESALTTATDGFALGALVKTDSVLAFLVGKAIDQIVHTTLVRLRSHWSTRDCQRLIQWAEAQVALPDPMLAALAIERENAIRGVVQWKEGFAQFQDGASEALQDAADDTPDARRSKRYVRALYGDPALRQRVFGELSFAVNLYFDRMVQQLEHPETAVPLSHQEQSLHEITQFFRTVYVPEGEMLIQRSAESRNLPRLLGVHAGIGRYRWETGHLPKTLAELRLARTLTGDLFTGKPLEYSLNADGTDYRLSSAGPATLRKADPNEPRKN